MIDTSVYDKQTNRLFGAFGKLGQNGQPVGGMSWFATELFNELGNRMSNKDFENLITGIIRNSERLPSIAQILSAAWLIIPDKKEIEKDNQPRARNLFIKAISYLIKKQIALQIPVDDSTQMANSLRILNDAGSSQEAYEEAIVYIDDIIKAKKYPARVEGFWQRTKEQKEKANSGE